MYVKTDRNGDIVLLSIYVDDLIITGNANKLITDIKIKLSQEFKMKDLGEMHYCLGLDVWRDDGRTLVTQRKFTNEVLKRFHMNGCKGVSTPLEQNIKLRSDDGTKEVNGILYRQLLGSLNYLTTTRPGIAYAVSILSQFMAKPHESHWIATKMILRYLKGTINFGIEYTNACNVELTSHYDSD